MRKLAGRYVLEREVGSGGMARVYLGRDEVLDRPVAVKVLKSTGAEETDLAVRFRREGRTAARLSHPNIVQVYDAGKGDLDEEAVSYIVMEYVPGGTLSQVIAERGTLPEEDLARLGEEICAGLAHAHERGVVHRDIKPHNILLDENGRAKVADFGIARASDTTQATHTGAYLGTALYSSPEQLQGQKVTPKTDVYSLGTTLYQAATGRPPFTGTPIEVASQHVTTEPPPLQGAAIGEDMQALILSCLSKNVDDRPSTEQALSRFRSLRSSVGRIAGAVRSPESATAPHTPPPPAPVNPTSGERARGRRRWVAVMASLAVLAVLGVVGVLAVQNRKGDRVGADTAQDESPSAQRDSGSTATSGTTQAPSTRAPSTATPSTRASVPNAQQQDIEAAEKAAEQAVLDFYTSAANGEYQRTAQLLTPEYRQSTWPTEGHFTRTFDTLQRIEFTSGPTARVDGNRATVAASTIAHHADRTDTRTGTANLVRMGNDWKIDRLNFS